MYVMTGYFFVFFIFIFYLTITAHIVLEHLYNYI